uniref:G protein-coupled receptor 25 n=1 Tax=Varanus komodoensis TaxID=61221 RepID=A0A8D2J303_VARKO
VAPQNAKIWSTGLESLTIDYTDDDICLQEELPFAFVFIPTLYMVIFFTGFFGNLFVILLMARKQSRKRLVDIFVLNLAIADLVFVCTLPFWALSEALSYWCLGEGLCKFSSYALSVNRYSSMLFLTGMSVERFLVMSKHWDSRAIGTKKNICLSCGVIWLISFLLGIPSLIYRKLVFVGNDEYLCQGEEPSATFNLFIFALTFLLPLGIILFCYCSIFSKLRGRASLGKRRSNALKIIFAIIGAFICSWLPFNTFKAAFIMVQKTDLSCKALTALKWGVHISICLAFTNSCINPVIYVFMDQQFRQQVWKNFPAFCSMRGNIQSSALSLSSTESSLLFAGRKKPAQMGNPSSRVVGL